MLLPLLLVLLSIGNIDAIIPIMVIIILIVAAAGATRGFSIFNIFGVSSILGGAGSVGGSSRTLARSGYPLRAYLDVRGGLPTVRRGRHSLSKRLIKTGDREETSITVKVKLPTPRGGLGGRYFLQVLSPKSSMAGTSPSRQAAINSIYRQARSEFNILKGIKEPNAIRSAKGGFVRLAAGAVAARMLSGRAVYPFTNRRDNARATRMAKETAQKSDMRREQGQLQAQIHEWNTKLGRTKDDSERMYLNQMMEGANKRLGDIEAQLGVLKDKSTRMGYEQFRMAYAQAHNRLYGAPDNSLYHSLFHWKEYGTTPGNVAHHIAQQTGLAAAAGASALAGTALGVEKAATLGKEDNMVKMVEQANMEFAKRMVASGDLFLSSKMAKEKTISEGEGVAKDLRTDEYLRSQDYNYLPKPEEKLQKVMDASKKFHDRAEELGGGIAGLHKAMVEYKREQFWGNREDIGTGKKLQGYAKTLAEAQTDKRSEGGAEPESERASTNKGREKDNLEILGIENQRKAGERAKKRGDKDKKDEEEDDDDNKKSEGSDANKKQE